MKSSKDSRLLNRIARGDERSLRILYDRHARLLAMRLRKNGASIPEAEDVLQETFLDVWQNPESFRGDGAVAAWLWGIARNKLALMIRREVRARTRENAAAVGSPPSRPEDAWASSIDVQHVLVTLAPDIRAAFEAVVIEELSTAEAAERLGIPQGTVKSRVHRARQQVQEGIR